MFSDLDVKNALAFLMLSVVASVCNAQFKYLITSTPDSALVKVNQVERGRTPCVVEFFYKRAKAEKLVIEVAAPGFEAWHDTIAEKPEQFNMRENVHLTRTLPKYTPDYIGTVVAFDKLLADMKEGTVVGNYIDKKGKVEPLKWEGSIRIGDRSFEKRFYEILTNVGFTTPLKEGTKLFSEESETRKRLPRFVVGVKLLDMRIDQHYDQAKTVIGDPVVGRTTFQFEWKVLDKATGSEVLSVKNQGLSRYRSWTGGSASDNIGAFEDGLIAFLEEGQFRKLVQNATGMAPSSASTNEAGVETRSITRPALPVFKSLSDLIGYADRSCVTVITDGGHGSGVIINEEGYVLSAYHVVDGVNRIDVKFSDGLKQEAKILAFDADQDIVLLDISGSGFRALPLAAGSATTMGEEVITIGTPAELELGQSVAKGILSGRRKLNEHVFLQTDMAVSPGNSGGPLINSKGEVIGIIQRKIIGEGVEGIGFALPIDNALEALHLTIKN